MKYLDKKPMFFDMGRKEPSPLDALQAEPAPSSYYTTAPASLKSKPPSLREQIEHELQNHEHCVSDGVPVEVRTAEVIGYHRALHWVLKLL
jgi:hypothetical protein